MIDPNAPGAQLVAVADGVYAWIGYRGDSNAGAIVTPDGWLAIDAQQYPRLAREFREAATAAIGKPVRELVNTHSHLDHTSGNVVFADVPILAHDKTLAAMERDLGPRSGDEWTVTDHATKLKILFGRNILELVPEDHPDHDWFRGRIGTPDYDTVTIAPPTRTFADDFVFRLPREIMRLSHWGPAHSDNDVVVYLEKSRVIFLGDLLFHGRFPWLGDCDLDGWIERLGRVLTLDIAVVIPGHGPPTGLNAVAAFRDMLRDLRAAVSQAIAAGWSEEAAVRDVKLPAWASVPRYGDWLGHDVRAVYRYLRGAAV